VDGTYLEVRLEIAPDLCKGNVMDKCLKCERTIEFGDFCNTRCSQDYSRLMEEYESGAFGASLANVRIAAKHIEGAMKAIEEERKEKKKKRKKHSSAETAEQEYRRKIRKRKKLGLDLSVFYDSVRVDKLPTGKKDGAIIPSNPFSGESRYDNVVVGSMVELRQNTIEDEYGDWDYIGIPDAITEPKYDAGEVCYGKPPVLWFDKEFKKEVRLQDTQEDLEHEAIRIIKEEYSRGIM